MKPTSQRPPLYTVWEEFCGWTLDRTNGIPKGQRFTFGQRLDERTLTVLEMIVACIYSRDKAVVLERINLEIELLRTLWRLVQKRGWISLQQLEYANRCLDEAGRMVGGWLRQQRQRENVEQPLRRDMRSGQPVGGGQKGAAREDAKT
jgi:hypothetical protein